MHILKIKSFSVRKLLGVVHVISQRYAACCHYARLDGPNNYLLSTTVRIAAWLNCFSRTAHFLPFQAKVNHIVVKQCHTTSWILPPFLDFALVHEHYHHLDNFLITLILLHNYITICTTTLINNYS